MEIKIKGEIREIFGKNASRRLRREGKVPANLYGTQAENVSLILDKKEIFQILRSEAGENTIFKVSYNSKTQDVMIKEVQTNPVNDELLHVDLILIAMDKEIRVTVPFVLTGEAVGVKADGGFADFVTREIELECLPKAIPEHIEVDISNLHLHQSVKVEELSLPEGAKWVSDPETVIVMIHAQAKEEVVAAEGEEEVIAEGEEPEVIKKEKPGEEEEAKKEE